MSSNDGDSRVFLDTNFFLTAYETYFKGETETKKQNKQKNDPTSIPSLFHSNQAFFYPILIPFCDNPTLFALLSIVAAIQQKQPSPTISYFLQISSQEITEKRLAIFLEFQSKTISNFDNSQIGLAISSLTQINRFILDILKLMHQNCSCKYKILSSAGWGEKALERVAHAWVNQRLFLKQAQMSLRSVLRCVVSWRVARSLNVEEFDVTLFPRCVCRCG